LIAIEELIICQEFFIPKADLASKPKPELYLQTSLFLAPKRPIFWTVDYFRSDGPTSMRKSGKTLPIFLWLMSRFGVLLDYQLNQGVQQGFSSFTDIMNELEESDVKKKFFL